MELKTAIEKRRSYRSLDPVEITENMVEELAQAASLAPSCFNKQPWRYVFVYKKASLDELKTALSEGNEWAREASMIIAVCSNADLDCRIKDGRDYYLFDTGMSVGIMMLKATEIGLICHGIAGYDPARAKEVLKLPSDLEVITLLIVGVHSDKLKPFFSEYQIESEKNRPPRLPLGNFAFKNVYGGNL